MNAELRRGFDRSSDRIRSLPMPRDSRQASLCSPPAISVHNDARMYRTLFRKVQS